MAKKSGKIKTGGKTKAKRAASIKHCGVCGQPGLNSRTHSQHATPAASAPDPSYT